MTESERRDVQQRFNTFSRRLCTVMSECDSLAARYEHNADLFSILALSYVSNRFSFIGIEPDRP